MKIQTFRAHHAANSSSSHSLVILNRNIYPISDDPRPEYGWDWFLLRTRDEKIPYIYQLFKEYLTERYNHDLTGTIFENVEGEDGYVDHQSAFYWQAHRGDAHEFFDDLVNEILDDKVAIRGGNDNEEVPSSYAGLVEKTWWDQVNSISETCNIRKEDGFYILYEPITGLKMRVSFDSTRATTYGPGYNKLDIPLYAVKARTPELVDLKITNYCTFGCPFCYQGSTTLGVHGELKDIKAHLDSLAELRVFEVAIGGGEPTQHPDFLEILRYANSLGIVPSFTTRNLPWVKEHAKELQPLIGAFAYSVQSINEARELVALDVPLKKHAHIVMGTVSELKFSQMVQVLTEDHVVITLLGYKTDGFGANVKKKYDGWWIRVMKESRVWSFCIDTALAHQYEDELALVTDRALYLTRDGISSMYIDAVTNDAARSSYGGDERYPVLPGDVEGLRNVWKQV